MEQKIIMKMIKERLKEQARDKWRNLSQEYKNKRENMEETDTIICLRKRNKDYQKNYREAKKSQYTT